MECLNLECPSKKTENPEIIMITNEDFPEISYMCSECKYIWGKYKK